jgi:hypothetical protein
VPTTQNVAQRIFHKKLYKLAAIKEAVAAYEDFASLDLQPSSDAWTVVLTEIDPDYTADVLASEFANFVLAMTIERSR